MSIVEFLTSLPEFIGDAVLRLVASEFIDYTFPMMQVGERSSLRSQLVSDRWLSKVGQSIEIQKHWMDSDGGLDFVDLDDHEWYDSGRPEMWLKAQIEHALKRDDYGDDFKKWLNQKLSE